MWILTLRGESFDGSPITRAAATALAKHHLTCLTTTAIRDFEDYLLPGSHPAIQKMMQEAAGVEMPKALKKTKVGTLWPEQNAQRMESRGLEWRVSSPSLQ